MQLRRSDMDVATGSPHQVNNSESSTLNLHQNQNPRSDLDVAMGNLPQVDNAKFFTRKLQLATEKLSAAIQTQPSIKDDPSVIETAYAITKPKVNKLITAANDAMKELIRTQSLPGELYAKGEEILESADAWLQHIDKLH